jgi:hypothetical protein
VKPEVELDSSLEEIDRLGRKNKNKKEKSQKYEKKDHDIDETNVGASLVWEICITQKHFNYVQVQLG